MAPAPDPPPSQQDEQGELSPARLGRAYADALGRSSRPAGTDPPPALSPDASLRQDSDDAGGISPRSILEALLFVGDPSGGPLAATRLAAVIHGLAPAELPPLVADLNRRYAAAGRPYEILAEADGYRMTLRRQFHRLRDTLSGRARRVRLSRAAIDVLALVAYHEPLSAEDVARARGAPSGSVLTQLVRRELLRIERPADAPRRKLYRTTTRFLDLFGLESLADLPTSEDFDIR